MEGNGFMKHSGYTIYREMDYIEESMEFLFRIVNNDSYKELKASLSKRTRPDKFSIIEEKLEPLILVEEELKKRINANDSVLRFFFEYFAGEDLCIAKILYQCLFYKTHLAEINEKKAYIKQKMQDIMNDDAKELNISGEDFYTTVYDNGERQPLYERINHLACSDSEKWKLFQIFIHADKYVEELFGILQNTSEQLKEFDYLLSPLKESAVNYWEDCLKKQDIMSLISVFYNLNVERYMGKETYIRIRVAACNRVLFCGNDETDGDYHTFSVGIIFDNDFRAVKQEFNREELCNGLKLLSDFSKFEILQLIKNKSAYGQEIAVELGLSTGTISHHMSALMTMGLINLERMDNRVYYRMNKEALYKLLEETKLAML